MIVIYKTTPKTNIVFTVLNRNVLLKKKKKQLPVPEEVGKVSRTRPIEELSFYCKSAHSPVLVSSRVAFVWKKRNPRLAAKC